jgi:hypothetical protein
LLQQVIWDQHTVPILLLLLLQHLRWLLLVLLI